jgi:hypothetical protein
MGTGSWRHSISECTKLQVFRHMTYLNPVINPQAMEKNISGT